MLDLDRREGAACDSPCRLRPPHTNYFSRCERDGSAMASGSPQRGSTREFRASHWAWLGLLGLALFVYPSSATGENAAEAPTRETLASDSALIGALDLYDVPGVAVVWGGKDLRARGAPESADETPTLGCEMGAAHYPAAFFLTVDPPLQLVDSLEYLPGLDASEVKEHGSACR